MSRRSGTCLRSCLVIFAVASALIVCGPALYWKFKTKLSDPKSSSCAPCVCDCPPPLSLLKIAPGTLSSSIKFDAFVFYLLRICLISFYAGWNEKGACIFNFRLLFVLVADLLGLDLIFTNPYWLIIDLGINVRSVSAGLLRVYGDWVLSWEGGHQPITYVWSLTIFLLVQFGFLYVQGVTEESQVVLSKFEVGI